MDEKYVINFSWDEEALVWIALSDDIPGLVLEHGSLDALIERVKVAAPELLSLNNQDLKSAELYYMAERHERIPVYG